MCGLLANNMTDEAFQQKQENKANDRYFDVLEHMIQGIPATPDHVRAFIVSVRKPLTDYMQKPEPETKAILKV